ncbi:TPA: hypothetical protein ACX6RT_003462 [Photobacterium damselae]
MNKLNFICTSIVFSFSASSFAAPSFIQNQYMSSPYAKKASNSKFTDKTQTVINIPDWNAHYEYAIRTGDNYRAKLIVKPAKTDINAFDDYYIDGNGRKGRNKVLDSQIVIGPFSFGATEESYVDYGENPARLAAMLGDILPKHTMNIDGLEIIPEINNVYYNSETEETIIEFSFTSKKPIEYMPSVAGFGEFVSMDLYNGAILFKSHVGTVHSGNLISCNSESSTCGELLYADLDSNALANEVYAVTVE